MGNGALVPLALAAAACLAGDCGGERASGPLVFGAASTADALTAAGEAFAANGGARPRYSFSASSTLARQVEAGAPAEVVVLASPEWMDRLEVAGRLVPDSRVDLAVGHLVWIVPRGRTLELDWSHVDPPPFEGRLALADPEHVPAGIYARQTLQALNWWEDVEERLAPAVDVRAALRLVELGEAECGIVYATDARASERVTIVAEVPDGLHDPIRYPAALVRGAGAEAAAFLAFLRGAEGARVLEQQGFEPLPREALQRDRGPSAASSTSTGDR